MEKHLHIIDFTVPYPADYGGVIDLFWKLPALQKAGVQIHLHCFNYGRGEQKELNKYCVSVQYYQRNTGVKGFSTSIPYIVSSRKNELLFNNLLQDDYPIFMEGVHSTYLLNDERFKQRKKFVRIHNVEYDYYNHLAQTASSFVKKMYYLRESKLLKNYEFSMAKKATAFWGVTKKDVDVYRNELGCNNIDFLPLYLPNNWDIQIKEGIGGYCLYQADLSVDANERAAIWLLKEVFSTMELPLVIAGKNPSEKLEQLAHSFNHTCIVANPNEQEMQDMIAKAHINILPSYSNTGIKLKLLNALFNGRHCVVNDATVEGTGLEKLCHIANDATTMQHTIEQLFSQSFSNCEIGMRKELLNKIFNNDNNAAQQVEWIWGGGKYILEV
ncbi:MAG TPA: glycosyltransferase family 4 protein [Chitinophagaceae bacterium]|nr:glycosyltransferase family 4 protein [Chitinophagaceae bacterium]